MYLSFVFDRLRQQLYKNKKVMWQYQWEEKFT